MQNLQQEVSEDQVKLFDLEISAKEINNEADTKGLGYYCIKRTIDLILCILALIFAIPIIIITCVAVVLDSKGAPIFKQERLGKSGKPFMLYKIRSMYNNAEEKCGAKWADKNDCRVTRVGKIIRKTRIDELPQLLNIIKGDMSIIGPRPERAIFYDKFEKGEAPGYSNRLLIKPGLTGYAQINGGYDLLPSAKLRLDMQYINNRSILEDIKIIFKTVSIVINGNGAR